MYPEHEKLKAISDKSQAIFNFLEWAGETHQIMLASYVQWYHDGPLTGHAPEELAPHNTPLTTLLAEHFGIDLEKIEQEKRAMLDELRNQSAA